MPHFPKPFFKKARRSWYVEINRKQIKLGPDRDEAFRRYHELMTKPQERQVPSESLAALIDTFLEWCQKHRAPDTFEWYRYRLERFVRQYPDLLVDELRPHHVQTWADGYELTTTSRRNYMRTCAFDRVRIRMAKDVIKRKGIVVSDKEIADLARRLKPTRQCKGSEVTETAAGLRAEAKRKLTNRLAASLAPRYSLYALRHTWATRALQNGLDGLTVAVLMGHSDPSTLARVYQHLAHNPQHLLEQAKRAAS